MSVVVLVAALAGNTVMAAPPTRCDLKLTVDLTPDVPDPRDRGFLSSLLSNHPGYQLTLLQQRNSSVIDVDLTGPGPNYRCQNVVGTMRKDGRVLSIHVH